MGNNEFENISNVAVSKDTQGRLKQLCAENGLKMIYVGTGVIADFLDKVDKNKEELYDFIDKHGKTWGKKTSAL